MAAAAYSVHHSANILHPRLGDDLADQSRWPRFRHCTRSVGFAYLLPGCVLWGTASANRDRKRSRCGAASDHSKCSPDRPAWPYTTDRPASEDLRLDINSCRAGPPSSVTATTPECFGRPDD